jgi:hypothetical protein
MKKTKGAQQKSPSNPPYYSSGQSDAELIAALAYSIWEQEGRPAGRDVEHWLQAEAQLRMCRVPDLA